MVATAAATAPVPLGSASEFAILAKSGISTVPPSAVEGDVGVSPIASTAMTGFSLAADPSNVFSTSEQITGRAYAANYASPTPSRMTTAILDMQAAYTDAAGRAVSSAANLNAMAGRISGATFTPGVYKWESDVEVSTDIYLKGSGTDMFIFQSTGNIVVGSAAKVILVDDGTGNGLPRASNIVWQLTGFLDAGTTSHLEGIFLVKTKAVFKSGSSVNGRILSQTACTLDSATIVAPTDEEKATGEGLKTEDPPTRDDNETKEPSTGDDGGNTTGASHVNRTDCPAGTFQPSPQVHQCEPCRPGTFANGTGNVACEVCGIGTYAPAGRSYCTPCATNRTTMAARTGGEESCVCSAGHFSAAGTPASPCAVCTNGAWSNEYGATVCNGGCPSHQPTSADGTGCGKCQHHATATASVCACDALYADTEGTGRCDLVRCPSGSALVVSENNTKACALCGPGTYSPSQDNSTACEWCDGATYQNENGGVSCKTVPAHAYPKRLPAI